MDYKLVAIDLDHTLLREDLTISQRTKDAIAACMAKGIIVTLATGRMYRSALPYALDLGLNVPLITYQGSLIKYADGREISHRYIAAELWSEIREYLNQFDLAINLYQEDQLYLSHFHEDVLHYVKSIGVEPKHIEEVAIEKELTKIAIMGQEDLLKEVHGAITKQFGEQINLTFANKTFLEISHPLATKNYALKEMAEELHISQQQVIAIGDNLNDLDMIEYAGLGVAMGNGVDELKKLANYVTLSNDDDGVAEVLEKYILGN